MRFAAPVLLAAALVLPAALWAGAERSCPAELATTLTDEQLAVLRATVRSTSHYDVQILTGIVGGRLRTVVLLGEIHWKDAKDSDIGREILAAFPTYGLEGVDFGGYWGGRAIEASMLAMMFVDRRLHGAARPSTIADARAVVEIWEQTRATLQALDAILSDADDDDETETIRIGTNFFTVPAARLVADELRALLAESLPRTYFRLEANYRPTVGENLGVLAVPLGIVGGFCAAAGALGAVGYGLCTGNPVATQWGGGILAGLLLWKLNGRYTPEKWNPIAWAMDLYLSRVLGERREENMARNILQIFTDHPDVETLLVVAGRKHVPGVKHHLEQRGDHGSPLHSVSLGTAVPNAMR